MTNATSFLPCLPPCALDDVRQTVLQTFTQNNRLILCAQPGSGKSSRVPLWLLATPFCTEGRILLLEPRRLAARALAHYMAHLMHDTPGGIVGFRTRDESRVGRHTRIEVVTEGVLTNMLQSNPELPGTACILFDEFHERSLTADTALAFSLETQTALRPDLRIMAMSATLDANALSTLLGKCPIISHEGRTFPVELRHVPLPPHKALSGDDKWTLWRHMADVILHLLHTEQGSLLAFLPGEGEIRMTIALLEDNIPTNVELWPLYGRINSQEQDRAIAPAPEGRRKVVLATSIAETSLTIDGIRIVVDSGLKRCAFFDASSGSSRLVTRRISLSEAAQRTGRAGRIEPGICYRLWSKEMERGMRPYIRPEILDADLSDLALQLAAWGVHDAATLPWLTPPPPDHLASARRTLQQLGALDRHLLPTPLGQRMAALPLAPRMAHMLLLGEDSGHAALAICLVALMEERDILMHSLQHQPSYACTAATTSDLQLRLDMLCQTHTSRDNDVWYRVRHLAHRLAQRKNPTNRDNLSQPLQDIFAAALQDSAALGMLVALTWPEQIAMRRDEHTEAAKKSNTTIFLLRSGRAVSLPTNDPLSREQFLAVAMVNYREPHGRIRLATALDASLLHTLFEKDLHREDSFTVTASGQVIARHRVTLGALLLENTPLPRPQPAQCALALCTYVRKHGLACLPFDEACRQWCARVAMLRSLEGEPWPDTGDAALLASLEDWLAPALTQALTLQEKGTAQHDASLAVFSPGQLLKALHSLLPSNLARMLDKEAPAVWQAPSGIVHAVVYGDDGGPWLEAKLQELFGCLQTPYIAGGRVPLTLHLNSPAGRALQITRDLAHFWREGYPAIRAEMRGRYPKHPWPENPLTAQPTVQTKKKLCLQKGKDT
ncbi:MAG: ATP-dependent helicase HrpB [Desulfovibrio sp.]|nr:ATP-dependent helicase HrpB [Desulfovibrio sp.]